MSPVKLLLILTLGVTLLGACAAPATSPEPGAGPTPSPSPIEEEETPAPISPPDTTPPAEKSALDIVETSVIL
jgi:hypothetical protein